MNISSTQILLLPALLLFFTKLSAQDTLIFKPTRKNPVPDTVIVKIILIEEYKFVEYVPYKGFFLSAKDSVRIALHKPINKRGATKQDLKLIQEIRYDEKLKHIIFFDKKVTIKRQNRVAYFKNKNILSGGIAIGQSNSLRPKKGIIYKGIDTEMPIIILQPSFERLFWKGLAGIKLSPVIVGLNKNYIGTGIGLRAYPLKQLPISFFIGMDMSFVTSTRYRYIKPANEVNDTKEYPTWYSAQGRLNELVIPFVAGLSFARFKHFYASLDGSVGTQTVLSKQSLQFNGEPYKYVTPVFAQLRLFIGRKY